MELGPIKIMASRHISKQFLNMKSFCCYFDESLNQVAHQCEIDFVIRFWDFTQGKVQVRFWN